MKAVGWITGLVVVAGMGALLLSTGCGKQQSSAPTATKGGAKKAAAGPMAGDKTYAELSKMAKGMYDTYQKNVGSAQLPHGATPPPPPWKRGFSNVKLKDTGTVVSVDKSGGRTKAMLDMDGDGKPDITLDLGAKNATQGAKATFTGTVSSADVPNGKLTLNVSDLTYSEGGK